jgi:hypothetical protein
LPLSTEIGANGLAVATNKTTYSVASLSSGAETIVATLTAAPAKPYYARIGDAFNGAADQNPVFIAEGSDGVVERQSGNGWVKVSSQVMAEGVREVVLNPGKSYSLIATVATPIQAGTYRLIVRVSEVAGGARTLAVQSPTFEVR